MQIAFSSAFIDDTCPYLIKAFPSPPSYFEPSHYYVRVS